MDRNSRVLNILAVALLLVAAGCVAYQVYHFVSLRLLINGVKMGRASACAQLRQMGDQAVGPLTGLLGDRNPTARLYGALLLGDIGNPLAVPGLLKALNDPHAPVRSQAALSLGHLGDRTAVPALIHALDDAPVRVSAVSSLGRLGDVRAVPALTPLLHDDREPVRNRVAWALAAIGGDQACSALLEALEEGDPAVVAGAHRFFIAEGKPGSEDVLVRALMSDLSTPWMAAAYLNSRNETLADAARKWAKQRLDPNRTLNSFSGNAPRWGSGHYSARDQDAL